MKYRLLFVFLVLGLSSLATWAQEGPTTLDEQFTEVMESSNRYKNYKVIKVELLNDLQKSIGDTVSNLKSSIEEKRSTIQSLQTKIDSLEGNTAQLTDDLNLSRKKENGMDVFGMIIQKSVYQTVVWSIIGLLILIVFILLFRYRSSNAITKEAKAKLEETEAEFEAHRQRALEREQQLRRKLQDEINKQKE